MIGDGVLPEARDTGNLLLISGAALLEAPVFELRLEASLTSDTLEIRYRRPLWERVDWIVETASDFGDWSSAAGFEESIAMVDDGGQEEVTLSFPLDAIESPTFFRGRWESLR